MCTTMTSLLPHFLPSVWQELEGHSHYSMTLLFQKYLERFSTGLNRDGIPIGVDFWFRNRAGEAGRHGWANDYRWIFIDGLWCQLMRG